MSIITIALAERIRRLEQKVIDLQVRADNADLALAALSRQVDEIDGRTSGLTQCGMREP